MTAAQSSLSAEYLRYLTEALDAVRRKHDAMAAALAPLARAASADPDTASALQSNDAIRQMLARLSHAAALTAAGADRATIETALDLDILPPFGARNAAADDAPEVELF